MDLTAEHVKRTPLDDGIMIDAETLLLSLADHVSSGDAEMLESIASRVNLELAIHDDLLKKAEA